MLMPIVSMNKMAMNESVAATCCFREMASPTNVYWEVMNGGWIGSGYVPELNWRNESWKTWALLGYDLSWVGGTPAYNFAAGISDYVYSRPNTATGDAEWYVGPANIPLVDWFATSNVVPGGNGDFWARGSACSHADGRCKYKIEETVFLTNQHFDSTTKHTTGGDDWALAHGAQRFNS